MSKHYQKLLSTHCLDATNGAQFKSLCTFATWLAKQGTPADWERGIPLAVHERAVGIGQVSSPTFSIRRAALVEVGGHVAARGETKSFRLDPVIIDFISWFLAEHTAHCEAQVQKLDAWRKGER